MEVRHNASPRTVKDRQQKELITSKKSRDLMAVWKDLAGISTFNYRAESVNLHTGDSKPFYSGSGVRDYKQRAS
jgi:hypothetical protein